MGAVITESVLTCPHCGYAQGLTMPVDACVYFFECPNCQMLLHPKPGDCCVFCSYGSVKCPSQQVAQGK
ncbi:MAG TPA: GDCCVxC domain-containing (seleno)protein [Gallionella sp.]